MAAIKKFFEKRKLEIKFKRAGEGHKLTDDTRTVPSTNQAAAGPARTSADLSGEARMAAEAAMARINKPKQAGVTSNQVSSAKTSMRHEILEEKRRLEQAIAQADHYSKGPRELELEAAPVVPGVFFHCALTGDEVLRKEEMEKRIEEFLLEQLVEEPEMTSALMIHTLNKNSEQIKQGIEMISKYLENIADHPTEDKYRKIRRNNKVLCEKVLSLRGTFEFLQAAGFQEKILPGPDGSDEPFLVFGSEESQDFSRLKDLRDILAAAEPIRPELDRCTKAFRSSGATSAGARMTLNVPDEFYAVSAEELRREQQARTDAVEKMGMLRTKEMRERDRQRELRRYRYCLIRVRFPDNSHVQATFRATEKLSAVRDWLILECLRFDWLPHVLTVAGGGQKLTEVEDKSTLAELQLAPAALLCFAYDAAVVADVVASNKQGKSNEEQPFDPNVFLKEELLMNAEYL